MGQDNISTRLKSLLALSKVKAFAKQDGQTYWPDSQKNMTPNTDLHVIDMDQKQGILI